MKNIENSKEHKYWLNEYGERYWYKNSDMSITAHRPYHWVNRVSFIKESNVIWVEPSNLIPYGHYTTTDRKSLGETTYTNFKKEIDQWIPIKDFDEYTLQLKNLLDYNL